VAVRILTSVLDGMGVSGQPHTAATLCPVEELPVPIGYEADLDILEKS
jgi:hypothetical protein